MSSRQVKRKRVPYDLDTALRLFSHQPDEARARAPLVRALYGHISESTLWAHIKVGKIPKPSEHGLWTIGSLRKALKGETEVADRAEAA